MKSRNGDGDLMHCRPLDAWRPKLVHDICIQGDKRGSCYRDLRRSGHRRYLRNSTGPCAEPGEEARLERRDR